MSEDLRVTSTRGRSRASSNQKPLSDNSEKLSAQETLKKGFRVEHELHMGLGDAVLRLIHVESLYANIPNPGPQVVAERKLLVEALNQKFQLNLGMDCDENGIPDSVEDSVSVFTHSAKTSCCRITKDKSSQKESSETESSALPKGRGFFATLFGN